MSGGAGDGAIRTTKRRGYTLIYNDMLIEGMSARAWGVYCYLLSKPDAWETRIPDLQRVFKEGRDALIAARDELLALGYLKREEYVEDGSNLRRYRYLLDADQENPATAQTRRSARDTGNPAPEDQDPEGTAPEDPSVVSTEVPTTERSTTENTSGAAGGSKAKRQRAGKAAPTPSTPEDEAADRIATAVYDGTKGSWKYLAVRGVAKSRMAAGATEEQVLDALRALWRSSRGFSEPLVQQVLDGVLVRGPDGILRSPVAGTQRQTRQEERERVIASDRERARQAEAAMAAMQEQERGYAPRAIKGGTP